MAHVVSLREAFIDFIADKECLGVSPADIVICRRNGRHFVGRSGVEAIEDVTPVVVRAGSLAHANVTPSAPGTQDGGPRDALNWLAMRDWPV